MWLTGVLASLVLAGEAQSLAATGAISTLEAVLVEHEIAPSKLYEILKSSNFLLEISGYAEALTTAEKKKLVAELQATDGAPSKTVTDGIEKVLAGLTPVEVRKIITAILMEPNLKSGLTHHSIESILKIKMPMSPAALAAYGEKATQGLGGPANSRPTKGGVQAPPKGGGFYEGMPTQPKPGANTGGENGYGGGTGGNRDAAGSKAPTGAAAGPNGGANSIRGIIACMDNFGGGGHKGSGAAGGGGDGGGDPNPVGTSVEPGGGGNAGTGKHGEPIKGEAPKGPGFGGSKRCYGIDPNKLSGGGQVSSYHDPSTKPGDYSWGVKWDDHAGHVATAEFKGKKVNGDGTIDGKLTLSKTDPSGKTTTKSEDVKGITPKENNQNHDDAKNAAKEKNKKENSKGGEPGTVKDSPPKEKGNDFNPDSDSKSACSDKDYNAFAACIGGDGGGKKADCDKFGQKGKIANPSEPSSGCPSNKAMALGLLPLQKLWDPTPVKLGAAASSKAPSAQSMPAAAQTTKTIAATFGEINFAAGKEAATQGASSGPKP